MRQPSATATPSPIPFQFKIVDDPNSKFNQVTGINQLSKVTGVWGGGSGSNISNSYTSQPPYTKFRGINYPGAQGTFVTSLSSNKIIAGYVIDPNNLGGIWGFVRVNALWTLLEDPSEGTNINAVTEILGMNDSELAVGFYLNASGVKVPFELNVPNESFTDLHPIGVAGDAEATAINGKGDITGWATTSAGVKGFFLQAGTYYSFSYPGATGTYATGINWSDQIVGYYVDADGVRHGFLLIGPSKGGGQQVWQSVDVPGAVYGTVVNGINNHHDICGSYIEASGTQHGFVAVP